MLPLIREKTDYRAEWTLNEEFDPGSERTLVACFMHASRASRAAMPRRAADG